ncbi:OmpA family protein [uncultured Polaribacter sp.]|uniref:OmpA family protein n=1 Tax=uncultured Polaribacter sp. TaxID=174711 RepID=UPI00260F03C9|nr:OmpA family protein [uncultured Polaribacter sp.]
MSKIRICIIGLLLFSVSVKAQNLDLPNRLFQKKSYKKAIKLFEKIENKSQSVYENLADSYYYNSQMEEAVKWYAELMAKHEATTATAYYFRYAQALKGIEDYDNADLWFSKYQNEEIERTDVKEMKSNLVFDKKAKSVYTISNLETNTAASDFGGGFRGNKLIFSSTRSGGDVYDWNKEPYLDLYQADIDDQGNLVNIQNFSKTINTELHESSAVFTKDGRTMFFTRNNYLDGKKGKDNKKVTHLKIYSAELVGNVWKNVKELPFNGDDYSAMHPALGKDDKELYFSSDMPGTIGSFDLFVVDINGPNNYGTPRNLGTSVNTEQLEQFPFYSKDTLYFSSNRFLGFGGLDVFKSYKTDDGFTEPENLQLGINSNLDDFGFVLDDQTELGYFSSNRKGGKGGDDIYKFKKAPRPLLIEGLIKVRKTLDLVENAEVTLVNKDSIIGTSTTTKDGIFNFKLETKEDYTINVKHSQYLPETYSFKTTEDRTKIKKTLFLDSPEIIVKQQPNYSNSNTVDTYSNNQVYVIDHEPIYFDLNSSYLRPSAKFILDDIVRVIRNNPGTKINCASHTDSRADYKYNQWLSLRRAKRTADYIISKGIDPSRITYNGYGETMFVNNCYDDVPCTEEEHQLNRRTEFIIE